MLPSSSSRFSYRVARVGVIGSDAVRVSAGHCSTLPSTDFYDQASSPHSPAIVHHPTLPTHCFWPLNSEGEGSSNHPSKTHSCSASAANDSGFLQISLSQM